MKNNILIIAGVTVVAIGVIVAVILASVLNSGENLPDSSDDPGSVVVSDTSETSEPPVDSADSSDSVYVPPSDNSDISDPSDSSESYPNEALGIVATANSLIGVPFLENGSDPDGFDNSGFIYYVLRENGYITCPRGTEAQSVMGTRLDYDSIKEGDLVFFTDEGGEEVSFGGIYAGDGKMIACLMPGTLVKEVDITTEYYRTNFYGGVSLT
ncbi:MAG: C40 family peptidase [Oscillospiraceae bacterium]|nr:C40 family peptidase [Oscillospiraceae bacterium]